MAPGHRASGQMLITGLALISNPESSRYKTDQIHHITIVGMDSPRELWQFSSMRGPRPFNGATFVRALVAS